MLIWEHSHTYLQCCVAESYNNTLRRDESPEDIRLQPHISPASPPLTSNCTGLLPAEHFSCLWVQLKKINKYLIFMVNQILLKITLIEAIFVNIVISIFIAIFYVILAVWPITNHYCSSNNQSLIRTALNDQPLIILVPCNQSLITIVPQQPITDYHCSIEPITDHHWSSTTYHWSPLFLRNNHLSPLFHNNLSLITIVP